MEEKFTHETSYPFSPRSHAGFSLSDGATVWFIVPGQGHGCSSFALRAGEGTLVAWNMDWWTVWQPYVVLLHGMPDDSPSFFTFAGSVGRPGMSEYVALAANYLPYRGGDAPGKPNHWEGPGVPYNFLCRMMLQQKNTADMVKTATSVRRMASLNYTIGEGRGDIRCIETTPLDHAEIRSDELAGPGDFLPHANSYLTCKFDGIPECELQARDPRTADARRQLCSAPRPLDRNTLMQEQCSHFPGETDGVCVHRQLLDKPEISLLSFIAQVGAKRMWAAIGPPCRHEFLEYRLSAA